MISQNKNDFMFIEPVSKKMESNVNDEVSKFVQNLLKNAEQNHDYTKGFHTCACKQSK